MLSNGGLLDLLLAVMALFDKNCRPTLYDGSVPVMTIVILSRALVFSVPVTQTALAVTK